MESFKSSQVSDWSVWGIPAFQDNYLWAIVHAPSKACVLVDPGCARSVQSFLDHHGLHLSGILVTHHHMDHVGGIDELLAHSKQPVTVWGPSTGTVKQVNEPVKQGMSAHVLGLRAQVLEVPGHTLDHVAYIIDFGRQSGSFDSNAVWMFCGDTLFAGGCGRLFEGTAEQMHESLQKLKHFPEHTLVFCAHEYTEANLRFARAYAPESKKIEDRKNEVRTIRQQGLSTIPTTLGIEKLSNLFINAKDPIEFKAIRTAKDQFKA